MSIDPQVFELLIKRFDQVDRDNQDIKEMVVKRTVEAQSFYQQVNLHKAYFQFIWTALVALGGLTMVLLGEVTTHLVGKLFGVR